MPGGSEVIVPVPVVKLLPVGLSLKSCSTCVGPADGPEAAVSKVAVTDLSLSIVTVQVVPVHAPDHPVKFEPEAEVAVNVTCAPAANAALHVLPQLIPDGLEVTEPDPDPVFVTVSVFVGAAAIVKIALTVLSLSIVRVQVVPVHAPLQLVNVAPWLGVAVSTTRSASEYRAVHVAPQSIPDGFELTVPVPLPDFVTVNVL